MSSNFTRALVMTLMCATCFGGLSPRYASAFQSKSVFGLNDKSAIPDAPGVIGGDGNYTVTAPNTVLNNYAILAADAAVSSTSFSVTNIADLNSAITQLGPIAVGDLLLIIQMQGATVDTSDTAAFGNVTALNNAGLYEFVTIAAIVGNTITISNENNCISGLRNSYTSAARTQVIRVPQFDNLTIDAGASVVATPWDGNRGGVVALEMLRTITINGSIDVAAQGFRGGATENASLFPGTAFYRSLLAVDGGEKGESIAGYQADYDLLGGRYGRGAAANGGGGGDSHNAGGGGGGNGNNLNLWTGQGVMPSSPSYAAWTLDPGYIANSNTLTNSSGGGRGGYSYSANNFDPNLPGNGPDNVLVWGGDGRREVGGLGGRPLTNNPASRLFIGGGGGAGDANNNAGTPGGRGGGLVILKAAVVTGTGTIAGDGQAAATTPGGGNDAPGGGGAGGTVVVSSSSFVGSISITANGGNGGNQVINGFEAEGPGGGGGGGYIAIRVGSPARSATGGIGGTTDSSGVNEFPPNGATDGASGVNNATVTTLPICIAPSAAPVDIVGRVATAGGMGISRASIEATDSQGNTRQAITNPFGFFRFISIPAGETMIVSVRHKTFSFAAPTQVIVPVESVTEIEFTAEP